MSNQGTIAKDNITAQVNVATNDILALSNELYDIVRRVEDFLVGPADDIAKTEQLRQKESAAEVIPWLHRHKNCLRYIKETLDKTHYHLNHINEIVQ